MLYHRYKSEILTSVGIILPIALVALGRYFTANTFLQHFTANWFYYVILVLFIYITFQYLWSRKHPLSLYKTGGNPDFKATVDLGHSLYWYLGMGAEELLRDVNIEEYFVHRRNSNRPIKSLRFLFLNPESQFFVERLREVHPSGDINAIAYAKKSYLRTVHFSLAALPSDIVQNYEIRYYDERPTWLLQFFDAKSPQATMEPDGVIVSVHIPRIHSQFSNQYICRRGQSRHVFEGFRTLFEAIWERAEPATVVGELPTQPNSSNQS